MSETLIRQYVETQNTTALISLFESIKDSRDRAELQVRAHLHTIKKLSESYANITEPNTGRPIRESAKPSSKQSPNSGSKTVSKSKSDLALDIDL